jgi:GntR family transcriptional regulator / MocR family aminotransferase
VPANRTSRKPEILIALDRRGPRPLHVQIQQMLRQAIRARRLRPGAAVPSTRTLAEDLDVSRGVVVEAYEQLIAEGYLVASAGSATRVTASVRAAPEAHVEPPQAVFEFDFRPGAPDARSFPMEAWKRATRAGLQMLTPGHLGYGSPEGAMELRAALADYLARVREVVGSAHQLIICTGAAQGLGIAGRTLRKHGVTRVAIEDPGHPEIRRIVLEAGLATVAVPVDDEGLRVDVLERSRAEAVILSPAHQNPMGSVLSPLRRQHVLDWATRVSGYIVEDDYDAEYRYDRTAVGALQGLAPERILYVGSASKILAPGLRLGWLLIAGPLLSSAAELKRCLDNGSPVLEQLTYAHFVATGELDRHLRRMRRLYQSRRAALLKALSRQWPGCVVRGTAAGLHLVAVPPRPVDIPRVVSGAAARSVRLYPLSEYATRDRDQRGLVFGYASLSEAEIAEAFRRIPRGTGRRVSE